MDKQQVINQELQDYMHVFQRYPMVIDHGEGPYLFDTEGKRYIDFLAGIAVNIVGHNYGPLVKAISEQAAKIIHCSNLYYTEVQQEAAAKLKVLTGLDKVFFANSGAEANEGAIKLARRYGTNKKATKTKIITAYNSFHGRTLATLTATGQPKHHKGFGPMVADFVYVDYNDIDAMKAAIDDDTCAVLIEAIQGEGGIYVPDEGYLPAVQALCEEHDALLMFDEVQCGVGRTGTFLGCQQFDVQPDVVSLAKGLGGGMPMGAFVASDRVAQAFNLGDHGSTFGGNPLACAAANVILDEARIEELMKNAVAVGDYLRQRLEDCQKQFPELIKSVRGRGLMLGMELNREGRDIVNACLDKGAIINCTAGTVLRFVPPLNITKAHVDELMDILIPVLSDYAKL